MDNGPNLGYKLHLEHMLVNTQPRQTHNESTFINMKEIPAQSKLISCHNLSTKISKIIFSTNLDNINQMICDLFSNEMILNIYLFSSFMIDRIFTQMQTTLTISVNGCFGMYEMQFS